MNDQTSHSSELEKIWRSPENRPDPAAIQLQMEKSLRAMRRRRCGFVLQMSLAGFWLAAAAGRLAWMAAQGGIFSLRQEWAAVLLLLLPIMALVVFVLQFRRHCRSHDPADRSVRESLRALLDENRLAGLRLKIIAGLYAAVLLGMPLIVHQLRAAGKAGDEILMPAFVLLPLLLLTLLSGLILHYRLRLLPRRRELSGLLEEYQ